MSVRVRKVLGLSSQDKRDEGKSVDEELDEYLERQKRYILDRAKWLELEEMIKKRELSMAEMEKKLEEIKGYARNESAIPKLSKEELEIARLLLEMKDEDRMKAIQILMLLKGGVSTAMPMLMSSGSDVSKIAETVNALVSAIKALTPQQTGQDVRDTLLTSLLNKVIELSEKRSSEARAAGDTVNELVANLLNYAIQQLTAPKGSELEYLSSNLDKLQNLVAKLTPPSQGANPIDTYKIWLEMKKIDQEYEKWKTELALRQQAEERKMQIIEKAIGALDLGGLIKSALPAVASSIRGSSRLPTVVCDPGQGGCGSQIPVPPNVREVVCAVCGRTWRIESKPSGAEEQASKPGQ